ncbi:thioredoxin fold domain-containing protein [Chondrinema litorale]|uniref:thioredoxin fold domain-containing protein n=1 Tax=Chondrinema litorale TaxID=2994555 RepID=UPI002543D7C5|nr:thioredoxin fold domain-containing protein [Chondrinema litorale]UZR92859.1 thioredoxin fold domain-containing protein [Chondrinema litorale]
MKKLFFGLLITILALSSSLKAQTTDFIFFDGSYEQLQTRALNSNKPYFVYFYANWSPIAKKMNEETFTNQSLVSYAQSTYLGLSVDGESILDGGEELAKKYNVLYFPSVLIFTSEGKMMARLSGFQTAQALQAKLKQFENATGTPDISVSEAENLAVAKEKPGEYLFKVSAKTLDRRGYGVQLGVYSNYRNTFMKLLELEEEKFHKNTMVFIKESEDNQLQYKIILGPFTDKTQADTYFKALMKDKYYKGSVLVDLSNL